MATAKFISEKKAILILKSGSSLTEQGSSLNTIRMKKDGTFSWMGIGDRTETVLEEKDLKGLFSGKKWAVDLM